MLSGATLRFRSFRKATSPRATIKIPATPAKSALPLPATEEDSMSDNGVSEREITAGRPAAEMKAVDFPADFWKTRLNSDFLSRSAERSSICTRLQRSLPWVHATLMWKRDASSGRKSFCACSWGEVRL